MKSKTSFFIFIIIFFALSLLPPRIQQQAFHPKKEKKTTDLEICKYFFVFVFVTNAAIARL